MEIALGVLVVALPEEEQQEERPDDEHDEQPGLAHELDELLADEGPRLHRAGVRVPGAAGDPSHAAAASAARDRR